MIRLLILVSAVSLFSTILPAQWVQTMGPEAGSVRVLFVDGTDVYAGTVGGGIFKSTDGGIDWERKSTGFGYQAVVAMAKIGPYLFASGTEGLFRSTDAGESWTLVDDFDGEGGVSSLASQGTHAIAGTSYSGVLVSSDTGKTWTPSNTGLPITIDSYWIQAAGTAGGGYLIYGGSFDTTAIYRSTDLGATWARSDSGFPEPRLVNQFYFDGNIVFAASEGVFQSTNFGASWKLANGGLPFAWSISAFTHSGTTSFAGGTEGVYSSGDTGRNWSRASGRIGHMSVAALAIVGGVLLAGTDGGGVYRSTDNGASWSSSNVGMRADLVSGFLVDGVRLHANGGVISRTDDDGASWTEVRGDLDDSAAAPRLVYASGDTLFAQDGSLYNHLVRSFDGGATWTEVWPDLYNIGITGPIVRTASGYWTASGTIYRSPDDGSSWQEVPHGDTEGWNLEGMAVLDGALFAYGQAVYRSTDDGVTWEDIFPGAGVVHTDEMTAVGSTLFIGESFSGDVRRSTDGGTTWVAISTPSSGWTVDQLYGSGGTLFLSVSERGLFQSTNLGASWTNITLGLGGDNWLYRVAVRDGSLFAGAAGSSVWKRPFPIVTAVEEATPRVPGTTELSRNYPNPFNPSTTVGWTVASAGRISIRVYDALGREQALLFEGVSDPGTHSTVWDASGLPGGVYYCRMTSASSTDVRAMLLVK